MYSSVAKNKSFIFSTILGFVLLIASLFVNFYAGAYASTHASNSVTDIVLSNTRVYHLDEVFVYGTWFMVLAIALVCFVKPQRTPFVLKSIAFFVLTRSVFLTLTHLAPFPNQITIDPDSLLRYFTFGADLFFSGHTGLPFLMALMFWESPLHRWFFLCLSIGFAILVLLAHLHYSIDVASAFFITYCVFVMAKQFFKKDWHIFNFGV